MKTISGLALENALAATASGHFEVKKYSFQYNVDISLGNNRLSEPGDLRESWTVERLQR